MKTQIIQSDIIGFRNDFKGGKVKVFSITEKFPDLIHNILYTLNPFDMTWPDTLTIHLQSLISSQVSLSLQGILHYYR